MARTVPVANPASICPPALSRRSTGRRGGVVVVALALAAGLLLPACSANRNAISEPEPSPRGSAPPPVDGGVPTSSIDAPPSDSVTLGERLGQLDAMMRTATGDSLRILEAEYDRLLREATGRGSIQTGRAREADGGILGSEDIGMEDGGQVIASYPREGRDGILDAPYDSTAQLHGLRASELRYAAGMNGRETASEARPQKSRTAGTAARVRTAPGKPAEKARESHVTQSRTSAASHEGAQSFVNGIAASRAGWHAEAAAELPKALSSPLSQKRKTLARYSYGQALESSGRLSQAADEYLNASKENTGLAHKSFVAYCRVLAKSGEKARAKKLLVQFIGKNPKSDQVVDARQLLQTL